MPPRYGTHADYMRDVQPRAAERARGIEAALRAPFAQFIENRQVDVIRFDRMTAEDLSRAIRAQPTMLKALLAATNIAGRAIERDLGIRNVDTYTPRLAPADAFALAEYLKPFLPDHLEISALVQLDRVEFIDKEIRKYKGRWETLIKDALNRRSIRQFKKRKFIVQGEPFELDAASPVSGSIEVGIDVKRIEARRDIHKRCDEIVNKASKLKSVYRVAQFAAVILLSVH